MTAARPVALVTGASEGIGLELARLFAADGYDLVLVARRRREMQALARELAKAHGTVSQVIAGDLGKPGSVGRIVETLAKRGLEIDALVNNAGFGLAGRFAKTSEATERDMLAVNIAAPLALTKALLPAMLERKRGGILNVSSVAAWLPGPRMSVYHATKSFLLSWSEALGEELRGSGVTVTALCPGITRTGFQARARLKTSRRIENSPLMMEAAPVARIGYRAFKRGRRVVITGAGNRLVPALVWLMPRGLLLRAVKSLQSPAR